VHTGPVWCTRDRSDALRVARLDPFWKYLSWLSLASVLGTSMTKTNASKVNTTTLSLGLDLFDPLSLLLCFSQTLFQMVPGTPNPKYGLSNCSSRIQNVSRAF
jgi:hypothetical protein